MEEMRNAYEIFVRKREGKQNTVADLGLDGG
jgi:hypothetical protein